jgi:hypothetical protein
MTKQKWEPKDINEAFFPVELRPLFMEQSAKKDGQLTLLPEPKYTKLPRHFAVVDVEKNRPFSVVTDDYALVTNEEAYDRAGDIMKRVFQTTTLEDMVCFNVIMPKTRSFCHIDLIHKGTDFSPWEEDKWTAFLRLTNSYNRTRLLRFELGFCRWICLNGMIFGSKSVEFSYYHTRRGIGIDRIDRFKDNIGDIRKLETDLIEKLHQLKRYHVPETEMFPILCRAFDIQVAKNVDSKPKRVEALISFRKQIKDLTHSYFSEMGPHGYAALNVLTEYASRPEGVIAPEASMHGLQKKAGNWVDDFIASIEDRDFSFNSYLANFRETVEVIESL